MAWTLLLGLLFGMRHALDADHVIAVSTIVSEKRKISSAAGVGVLWGAGHTLTLFLAGLTILAFKVTIPMGLALSLEFSVGVMLVVLGVLVLRRLGRERIHAHVHTHDGVVHWHFHSHATGEDHHHEHAGSRRKIPKSLCVGMVHGLAGSGTLMLLVLTTIRSIWEGLLYILVFGAGTVLGMTALTMVIGTPFVLLAARFGRLHRAVSAAAGLVSLAFGSYILYEIGWVRGLF